MKRAQLLNIKIKLSSIWAKGCILMTVCVCFTWLDMTTPHWCREKVMVYYYYIITQTLINETVLNCSFNCVCNCKPKATIWSSFILWLFLMWCVQSIRELTLVYRPMLSTYMLNSNQLLVYQLNTLWDGYSLMSSEKHPSNTFWYKFTIDSFFCVCVKTEKTVNIWIIFFVS